MHGHRPRRVTMAKFQSRLNLDTLKATVSNNRYKLILRLLNRLNDMVGLGGLSAIRPQHAIDLLGQLLSWRSRSGRPLAPTTLLNYASAIQSGIFVVSNLQMNNFPKWRLLRQQLRKHRLRHVLKQATPMMLRQLRVLLTDIKTPLQIRLAVLTAWGTGMRISDLFHLEGRDVTLIGRALLLRLRGAKMTAPGGRGHWRWIPLTGIYGRLLNFFAGRSFLRHEKVFDFPSRRILRALKRIDPKLSLHSVRRGVATTLANHGISMLRIRNFLGHSQLTSTRLYVQPTPTQREARQTLHLSTLLTG